MEPPDYTVAVLFQRSIDIGAVIGLARTVCTHTHAGSDFVELPEYTVAVLFQRSFDIGAFIGLARTVFTHTHTQGVILWNHQTILWLSEII